MAYTLSNMCAKNLFKRTVLVQLIMNKKLSCRRETARRFVSLNILLSNLRSLKVIRNDAVE